MLGLIFSINASLYAICNPNTLSVILYAMKREQEKCITLNTPPPPPQILNRTITLPQAYINLCVVLSTTAVSPNDTSGALPHAGHSHPLSYTWQH